MTKKVTKAINNAYIADLLKGMVTQRKNKQFTDVELESGGALIPCHRVVLAAASPYFNSMFTSGIQERAPRTVHIKVDPATLADVVDYFYTAEVEYTVDNVRKLLEASDLLQLNHLKAAGEKFMLEMVEPANCIGFYNYACLHRFELLQTGALRVMLGDFKSVVTTPEFMELTPQQLIDYIREDGINVEDENLVLESVLLWVKHDRDKKMASLKRIFQHVRLSYCTINYLHHVVNNVELLAPECRKYLRDALQFHIQAALRHEISSCRMVARTKFRVSRRLLVVGGCIKTAAGDTKYTHCHYLAEDGKSWNYFMELPQSAGRFYCVCRTENGFLMTGGALQNGASSNCLALEFAGNKWRTMPPLNTARCHHSCGVLGDHVYVLGGIGADGKVLQSVERLAFRRRQWSSVPDIPQPLYLPMVASYDNGVYVFGGRSAEEQVQRRAWMYDTMWSMWRNLADMPEDCAVGSAVSLNQYIYVVGGVQKSCLRYDPASDSWTTLSRLRLIHGFAPAVVWQDRILVAGGLNSDSNSLSSLVEQYDVDKNKWSNCDIRLKTELSGHFLFNVDLYGIVGSKRGKGQREGKREGVAGGR